MDMEQKWLDPANSGLMTTAEWFKGVAERLPSDDPEIVYRSTQAVLFALRDRLMPNEALDLGAQFPSLLRGLYFEGYKVHNRPVFTGGREAFLERVSEYLREQVDPDAEQCTRAVFEMLDEHISKGEMTDVGAMLPKEMNDLWPTDTTT
jgi:uncharacterized protein (DUF2267 family)